MQPRKCCCINLVKGARLTQRSRQLVQRLEMIEALCEGIRSAHVGQSGLGAMRLAPAFSGGTVLLNWSNRLLAHRAISFRDEYGEVYRTDSSIPYAWVVRRASSIFF